MTHRYDELAVGKATLKLYVGRGQQPVASSTSPLRPAMTSVVHSSEMQSETMLCILLFQVKT
jgi:hypothetical protein